MRMTWSILPILRILAEEWLQEAVAKKLTITIDHNQISQTLYDFPVLITQNQLPQAAWNMIREDGENLWFDLPDGTLLDREVVTVDSRNRNLEIHVRLPEVSASTDTVFNMHFHNAPGYSFDTAMNVWDENFISVYHMNNHNENPGSGIVPVLEAGYGNQGMTYDGEYFYWGRNMGEDVDGRIYKLDRYGNLMATFTGPSHASGGDVREDHDTLIFHQLLRHGLSRNLGSQQRHRRQNSQLDHY